MRSAVIAFAAPLFLFTAAAYAASPADQAAADALFTEGKKLATAGDYEHACPKLAESNRLDPGAGTLLNLGDCYEKLGRLASAWATFNDADGTARKAGDTARAAEAARRAQDLAPRLPKVTIRVPPAARVAGLEIRRDGSLVGEAQWGSPVPVDPGEHTIEASVPGRAPWQSKVSATAGAMTVDVPVLGQGGGSTSSSWSRQRIAGVAVGSGGVAVAVIGAVLGGLALQKNSASKADCSPANPNVCTAAGVSSRQSAIALGNGSTAALAIGGALAVTGIVLFATGGASKVEVRPGAGSLSVRATF